MLGTRIASLRQSCGFSQADLAQRLHISTSAVGMYEQGRREPSVNTLIELAQVFGVSLDYLLSGRPDTIRDISAIHRLMQDGGPGTDGLTKEEMMCHLLWALIE